MFGVAAGAAFGEDLPRARQNYMLFCQGCHLPDGAGAPGAVPRLNGFVGNFLHVPGGREFVVQVPGVAGSPLDDAELSDVLNWMLVEFSAAQLPARYAPYSAGEVGALRAEPMMNVKSTREALVGTMVDHGLLDNEGSVDE
jgi:hypothetical protein